MSMSDPIADMLTRIRNAQGVEEDYGRNAVVQSQSCDCQRPEGRGLHRGFCGRRSGRQGRTEDRFEVLRGRPGHRAAQRVSRPGLRIYKGKDDIPSVMNGLGVAIVSTPKGVMTDRKARATGVGGEVICYVA